MFGPKSLLGFPVSPDCSSSWEVTETPREAPGLLGIHPRSGVAGGHSTAWEGHLWGPGCS